MQNPKERVSVAADACGTSKNLQSKGVLLEPEPEFLEGAILGETVIFITRISFCFGKRNEAGNPGSTFMLPQQSLTMCFFITIKKIGAHPARDFSMQSNFEIPCFFLLRHLWILAKTEKSLVS